MKSLSILFIDDDEIERLKFKKVCESFNKDISILEAENGKNALVLLNSKTTTFDLIVSDLNMPVMDGFEFLEELKKNSKHKKTPVVIVSSLDDKETIDQCYKLGIASYFTKTQNFADYKTKINSILEYWYKATF